MYLGDRSAQILRCHTEIEVSDQTGYLTQYTDTGQTIPSSDPVTPGTWQGSHTSASCYHFPDGVNSTESPSVYQVLLSASFC